MAKDDFGRNERPPAMKVRLRLFKLWSHLARTLPRIQWVDLTPGMARDLELSPMVRWQVLEFAWGTFGIVIAAKPAEDDRG